MNRRDVLKSVGAIGVGSMIPIGRAHADPSTAAHARAAALRRAGVDCVLIPQETEGPYPLDLSGNSAMIRQDVTEGRPGTRLNLVLNIVNINDECQPVANARVDIWHCDKEGVYSGFSQPGANTVGQTFMRGIQMTDDYGRVEFHTIYPGWYAGRITHIHFQVFIGSMLRATSQIAFPEDLTKEVYATEMYASKGQNTSVSGNAADNVFNAPASALQYEMLAVTVNTTSGYDGTLTVGIDAPKAGVLLLAPETGGQFTLNQNAPNPFANRTAIAFSLLHPSHAQVEVFDLNGRPVTTLLDGPLGAGEHAAAWDGLVSGIPAARGNYFFQLTVTNAYGTFRQAKVMTLR